MNNKSLVLIIRNKPGGSGVELRFGLVRDVPLAAQYPYPCSGVIFTKINTIFRDFLKKVPIPCDYATKTHQIFRGLYREQQKTLKIRPIVTGFFHAKRDPCLGISCKEPAQNCDTSTYVLTCEYPRGKR